MITKDVLKSEIERIQEQDIETVYKLIRVFTMATATVQEKTAQTEPAEDSVAARKAQFFEFVKTHAFPLPADYTFNREELYER